MRDLKDEFNSMDDDDDLTKEWMETTYDSLFLTSQDITVTRLDWDHEEFAEDE